MSNICNVPACGREVKARGFCVACYYRKLRGKEFEAGTPTRRWKHRLSEIDTENKKAICTNCGPVKITKRSKDNRWRCSVDANARSKDYKKAYRQIKKEQLLDHCEICNSKDDLCWDHDHLTGLFRGTLCNNCNIAIGLLQDDPTRCINASQYLKRT